MPLRLGLGGSAPGHGATRPKKACAEGCAPERPWYQPPDPLTQWVWGGKEGTVGKAPV